MRGLISHLRYTARLLLKSPGFTITAVLVLGLGIGANTAIFSLVNAVVLKPLPFPEPERLVLVFMPFQNVDYMPFDYPDYEDIKVAQSSFQELATFSADDMNLTGRGAAERIEGAFVSPEMFDITGHRFLLGRPFTKDEDKLGGPQIVVAERSATRRLGVFLVGLFSGSALFLSAVGLYAVLAYSVAQRKREIGVRIALGAQTFNILRLVVRHGLKIVGTGLLIGIAFAAVLTRFIEKVLYGVSSYDPITLMIAVLVLTLAGLLACLLPAFRATRVNPIKVLRE